MYIGINCFIVISIERGERKGKDFYEETLPAAITAQKEIKAVISSKESDQIMKILKKMEKGLERELE